MRERLKTPPAPEVITHLFGPAVSGDALALFAPMMQINKAHVCMLAATGIIGRGAARDILRHLVAMERDGVAALALKPELEDMYFNIEAVLLERAGVAVGGQMHTGRSRNDIYATAARLLARQATAPAVSALVALRDDLLREASKHLETVMPAYTHLQPAQPTTLAHYLAAVAQALGRDADRLLDALERLDASPMGAGSSVTTGFPISREQTAAWLGFTAVLDNAIDAIASRDFVPEILAALAMWATTMSRLAHDFYLWSTDEFAGLAVPDAAAIVSSIMPQKKNPITLEHVKAKAAHVQAALLASLGCMKGTPFGHSRDLNYESVRPLGPAIGETMAACDLLRCTLRDFSVDRARWRERAAADFCTVTELADLLVREFELSFRQAHQVVSAAVDACLARRLRADEIRASLVDDAANAVLGRRLGIADDQVRLALDPLENVRSHRVKGGPAPEVVHASLDALRADNQRHAARLARLTGRWDAAARRLSDVVESIIAGRSIPLDTPADRTAERSPETGETR